MSRNNSLGEPVITAIIYPSEEVLGAGDPQIEQRVKDDVASVNKKLPSFKQIRNIEIRKNEFEKTPTQKIKRYKL